jgi:hypothetical protein
MVVLVRLSTSGIIQPVSRFKERYESHWYILEGSTRLAGERCARKYQMVGAGDVE